MTKAVCIPAARCDHPKPVFQNPLNTCSDKGEFCLAHEGVLQPWKTYCSAHAHDLLAKLLAIDEGWVLVPVVPPTGAGWCPPGAVFAGDWINA